ncbi:MAG: undecaprenyldiphospho-muramoylpentapeptide beta-N-acetylglucosaminyltransferase [Saprospiraceae bacterium]|nr:undecaprenyldiphospho-muramoylpentapeptide beta-N-acetylglucosaminyltransferase [Saprospiraceae bacterium]
MDRNMKIIISGGGSGGHIFPAIAIANALKEKGVKDILFVGANGKIEMEKVPNAGYEIVGLNISGFHRRQMSRNLKFPFKLIGSLLKAKKIIDKFNPDVVVGVGGFASGPMLKLAQWKGIPTLIQEQNSYPGITNKLLAGKADRICVAYDHMDSFFKEEKILLTGNPVRKDLTNVEELRSEAYTHFDLDQNKKTLFIFGGSLGARSINNAIYNSRDVIKRFDNIQLIWQVGKLYHDEFKNSELAQCPHVKILPFIDRMDLAYSAADVIICRAGALTISELAIVGKPAIFIPSPNVAEDHQTKNAKALSEKDAALLIRDDEAKEKVIPTAIKLLEDKETQRSLSFNLKALAKPEAREAIANEVLKLVKS